MYFIVILLRIVLVKRITAQIIIPKDIMTLTTIHLYFPGTCECDSGLLHETGSFLKAVLFTSEIPITFLRGPLLYFNNDLLNVYFPTQQMLNEHFCEWNPNGAFH